MLTIRGSHGELLVAEDGSIIELRPDGDGYKDITGFNVKEFRKWEQNNNKEPVSETDILFVGYWYSSAEGTGYEPPCPAHRAGGYIENSPEQPKTLVANCEGIEVPFESRNGLVHRLLHN